MTDFDPVAQKLEAIRVMCAGEVQASLGIEHHRPIFVTGTGTDVGKTYVTASLCRMLVDRGINVGYYKAAISGAEDLAHSDAGYVKGFAYLRQDDASLTSYLYKEAVSPHLAAKHRGEKIELDRVLRDMLQVYGSFEQLVMEGSGGIFCPLRWDEASAKSKKHNDRHDALDSAESPKALVQRLRALSDKVSARFTVLDLMCGIHNSSIGADVLVVADAALGVINDVVMTVQCLELHGIKPEHIGVILNRYIPKDAMYEDNYRMIELMTDVKVVGIMEDQSFMFKLTAAGLDFFASRRKSRK